MTLRDLETEILETEILKQVVILYSNLLRNICTIVLEILLVCRNVVGIQLNDTSFPRQEFLSEKNPPSYSL